MPCASYNVLRYGGYRRPNAEVAINVGHFWKHTVPRTIRPSCLAPEFQACSVGKYTAMKAALRVPASRCLTSLRAAQVFRDSARAWSCHLYAFAAPNEAAMAALADLAPILEVGAGVGYWAHLLRERDVTVVATDELPTSRCKGDAVNQYHGRVPCWTHVEQLASSCTADYSCVSFR